MSSENDDELSLLSDELDGLDLNMNLYDYILGYPTGLQCSDFVSEIFLEDVIRDCLDMEEEVQARSQAQSYLDCQPSSSSSLQQPPLKETVLDEGGILKISAPTPSSSSDPVVSTPKLVFTTKREGKKIEIREKSTKKTKLAIDLQCKICKHDEFGTAEQLQTHLITEHSVRVGTSFNNSDGIFGYDKDTCHFCQKTFQTFIEYLVHISVRSNIMCLKCDQTFGCMTTWISHFRVEHVDKKKQAGQTTCTICCRSLSTKDNLIMHYVTHVENLEYYCRFCLTKFRTPRGLQYHLKTQHEQELTTAT